MDEYYLKPIGKPYKVEKYTYEYDEYKDSMSSGYKYCVDIIFEDDEFDRLDFGDKNRKRFDSNLRPKELDLLNKIQDEIKNIKERREKEKYDILKIKFKPGDSVELINSMVGDSEESKTAQEVFKSAFGSVLSYVLNELSANKIALDTLKVPSIKVKIPLEYEIEIFNPNLQLPESEVGQSPI
jgi:hypothetical protein